MFKRYNQEKLSAMINPQRLNPGGNFINAGKARS